MHFWRSRRHPSSNRGFRKSRELPIKMKLASHISYYFYLASGKRSFKIASLLLSRHVYSERKTIKILEQAGATIARPVTIRGPLSIEENAILQVEEHAFINFGFTIIGTGRITIGINSLIGPNTTLITASHHIDPQQRLQDRSAITKDIHIGENVWIGANVTICPGVTIGRNTTIGAGSVVTKDIPDNVFAAGSPCKLKRNLANPVD
jgi:acetyltransferase-like isoleucine patch superfamily enzyme